MARQPCCHNAYNVVTTMNIFTNTGEKDYKTIDVNGGMKLPESKRKRTTISLFGLVGWIFQALVGCHDILILGKSPIKWRQRPDMTLAVDSDVKH